MTLTAGASLALHDGTHQFEPGAQILGNGVVDMTGVSGSTLTGTGLVHLARTIAWRFDAGQLHGKFAIDGGAFVWAGGTAVADITVNPGTTMRLTGTTAKTMHGDLISKGVLTWQQGPALTVYGRVLNVGALDVAPPAKLVLPGTDSVTNSGALGFSGTGRLTVNAPTFTKTAASTWICTPCRSPPETRT